MKTSLTKIHVENFKSLENFEMSLNQFNVLIGPNGSGKTNVLELCKFINLCVVPQKTPAYPFASWGGYKNLVWSGNEHQPINTTIEYTINGNKVIYDSTIMGSSNGRLEILWEYLTINEYMTMELKGDNICYSLMPDFVERAKSVDEDKLLLSKMKEGLEEDFVIPRKDSDVSMLQATKWNTRITRNDDIAWLYTSMFNKDEFKLHVLPSPIVSERYRGKSLYKLAIDYLADTHSIILLRHLNYDYLREPTPVRYLGGLNEDGDGLINLLFQWFNERGKLPDIFTLALEMLFPGWQISFKITDEGNILMWITNGTVKLAPSSIPDGFYKLLAVLAAIELNPKLLLIDEIETSLHARIIEYIVDLLKDVDSTVIVTTHSPLVVDYVNMDDLILMENTSHVSTCRKIKNPNEIKKELAEKEITVSESWLYGEL